MQTAFTYLIKKCLTIKPAKNLACRHNLHMPDTKLSDSSIVYDSSAQDPMSAERMLWRKRKRKENISKPADKISDIIDTKPRLPVN